MVRKDPKKLSNSSNANMKLILPTRANTRMSNPKRNKKLRKFIIIFANIFISGPMLSEYYSIVAILKIKQATETENRYWNLKSMLSAKLAKILCSNSVVLMFGSV